ncbi:MAG: CopG family transcriptional regulator [Sulfuriferula sp.]
MRTLIDIPNQQIDILTTLSKSMHISRAELMRRAIDEYVSKHKPQSADAFGLWKDNQVDGVDYQTQARSEW